VESALTGRLRTGRLGDAGAWLVPAAAAAVAALHQGFVVGGDAPLFRFAGRTLVSSHWSHAFALPSVQAGPLQLALFGSVGRSNVAFSLVLATGTALLAVAAVRSLGVRHPALLAGAGLVAVGSGLTRVAYASGHPADAVIPLLWILAAAAARRDRMLRASLLVSLSAGLETWGILGVAVLALAPRWLRSCAGAAVAAAAALGLFLPFVAGGHFAMWSFVWHVYPPSPLSLLVASGTPFGWPLRLAQGMLAVGAGVAVARLLRASPHALWAAPLAIVAAKLLLDPVFLPYYRAAAAGPIVLGLVLGASRVTLQRRERRETYAQPVNPSA
jgi:hypothetical protein